MVHIEMRYCLLLRSCLFHSLHSSSQANNILFFSVSAIITVVTIAKNKWTYSHHINYLLVRTLFALVQRSLRRSRGAIRLLSTLHAANLRCLVKQPEQPWRLDTWQLCRQCGGSTPKKHLHVILLTIRQDEVREVKQVVSLVENYILSIDFIESKRDL